jgi:hypothetical protein
MDDQPASSPVSRRAEQHAIGQTAAAAAPGAAAVMAPASADSSKRAADTGGGAQVKKRFGEVIKSESDNRQYRAVVLKNNLKVMLVSDPTTDKAAAAMDVHIGSLTDPWELPGLLHEHCLVRMVHYGCLALWKRPFHHFPKSYKPAKKRINVYSCKTRGSANYSHKSFGRIFCAFRPHSLFSLGSNHHVLNFLTCSDRFSLACG